VLVVKNLPANIGDTEDVGSIPGLGKSPGKGHGNPLQNSFLENLMDRGDWMAIVHGVLKAIIPEVVCHSLLKWTTFCQNFPPLDHHYHLSKFHRG